MPNWAYTTYYVIGPENQLRALSSIMTELEEGDEPLLENGFGKTWLGCLVYRLGGDPKEIECRGSWYSQIICDGLLTIEVESAWQEPIETRRFLAAKFPRLKFYYQCVEEGMEIYETNDRYHRFAPRFALDVDSADSDYYQTLQDLITAVESITGTTGLTTYASCRKALAASLPAETFSLHRFRYLND